MGTANNMKYRPYLPYIIDGLTALFFCLVVSLGTMIMYVSLGMYEVEGFGQFLLVVYALGFLYECIVNFRFMLLSVIEVHFNLYKSEQLQLVAVRKAYETVWRYESKLPCFFPKYRYVDKTVLDFRREDGSVIQLRCVFHGMNQEGKKNNRSSRKARKTAYRTRKNREIVIPRDKKMISSSPMEKVLYGRYSRVIIKRNNITANESGLWRRDNWPSL